MSTIILQRFANREYRLTKQSLLAPKKQKGDKYAEKQAEKYAQAVHSTYVLEQSLKQGVVADYSDGSSRLSAFGEVEARQALRSLDIINEFQRAPLDKVKGGWGHLSRPTSFTKNARHRLLEAGAIVDKFCGLNAYEITCTLPGSTSDSMRLLAENTGYIMNIITQLIRRAKCKYWFYVWELQKRGALHLHLLVASPEGDLKPLAERLQSRWWELLKSISRNTGRDAFARKTGRTWRGKPTRWQSHIAPIQKSVAAYFSKYAGKGRSTSLKKGTSNRAFSPSRWWGCSTEIKAQIKAHRQKHTLTVSSSTSAKVYDFLQTWLQDPGLIRRYEYDFDLGQTANGTNLGGGHVCINYYADMAFARMQTWENIMWDGALAIAHEAGEYDYPTQTWTDVDMACPIPLYADMERRHQKTRTSTTPPPSQQSSERSKLRNARGTQPEATLALRALLVQFLAGGGGVVPTEKVDNKRPAEYIQGELFDKSCYRGLTESEVRTRFEGYR